MIVRNINSCEVFCISQLHHSIMTGELVKAWKSGFTPPLDAFDKVEKAALLHDFGWLNWEATAQINPETQHPYDFLEMPKEAHLDIWKNGLLDTAVLDPLIGLLVLRHNMTLAQNDAKAKSSMKEFMEMMQSEDEKLEKLVFSYMPELDKAELARMNAFILFTDYISLRMLMGTSRANPFGPPPEVDGISFDMKPVQNARETMSLSPWPFARERFEWKATGWIHQKGERFETLPASTEKEIRLTLVPG